MKLNSSPSGTPSWRKRRAIGESAPSRMTNPPRIPAMLAGDRRKILRGPDRSPQRIARPAWDSGMLLPQFKVEDHIGGASDVIQIEVIFNFTGNAGFLD